MIPTRASGHIMDLSRKRRRRESDEGRLPSLSPCPKEKLPRVEFDHHSQPPSSQDRGPTDQPQFPATSSADILVCYGMVSLMSTGHGE